jgi:TPR repeat protein
MELLTSVVLAAALAAGPATPAAESPDTVVAPTDAISAGDLDERVRLVANFPNELYRLYGSEAAGKGQWHDALRNFTKAAHYADKYSQHRISLMYWHGAGVARDPALAYAWADLAAERAYPGFLVLREKIWMSLSPAEKDRALSEGEALYAKYGDKVAKRRLAAAILRQNTQITGSRTGQITSKVQVRSPPAGAADLWDNASYEMNSMYASWRLDPERYWAVEDAIWKDGAVEIGPAEKTGNIEPQRP